MQSQATSAAPTTPAMPPDDTADSMPQFLRFTVGGQVCAVRIDDVREILELSPITPVPLMPDFVHGVMNLRGAVVPVVDLSARLGLGSIVIARRSCVVVIAPRNAQGQPRTLGMLVDAVHEVFNCAESSLEPVPRLGTVFAPAFVRAMVRTDGQVMSELALDTLLGEQVLAELIGASLRH